MSDQTVAVIMAGGGGERFWPMSRRLRPKQLLRLSREEMTLLEEAVERISPIAPRERVLIATNELLRDPIKEAMPDFPPDNIVAEPMKRNTSGCLALAAAHAIAKFGGDPARITMAVLTADHMIGEDDRFLATAALAIEHAENESALVTVGIAPSRPETGYGYIEVEDLKSPAIERDGIGVYRVVRFAEKPDLQTAERFIRTGRFFWNSGMFFWRVSTFLSGLDSAMPSLSESVREIAQALDRGGRNSDEIIRQAFYRMDDISIDYGLLEKADNVFVARADFTWDDLGAWPALSRTRSADGAGNITWGGSILLDCRDCVVVNEPGDSRMAVGVIGMSDVVVVATEDGFLVCPRDRAQDVKEVVKELRSRGARQV